jgi:hypothetical protein
MTTNCLIMWSVIWSITGIVAVRCNDSSVMLLPGIGMLIWYLIR